MVKYVDGLDPLAIALANPGRRHIVDRLRAGPATTTELAVLLDIGLPAVTKQVRLLQDASLLDSTKRGRVVTHRLDSTPLDTYASWLATRRSFWHGQLDALDAAVAAR